MSSIEYWEMAARRCRWVRSSSVKRWTATLTIVRRAANATAKTASLVSSSHSTNGPWYETIRHSAYRANKKAEIGIGEDSPRIDAGQDSKNYSSSTFLTRRTGSAAIPISRTIARRAATE